MTNSKMNVSNRLAVIRKTVLALAILLGAGALIPGTASAADFHHGGPGWRGHERWVPYRGPAFYPYPGYAYAPSYGYAVAPPVVYPPPYYAPSFYAPPIGLNLVVPLRIR
jgi:hypothetical protein